MSKADLKAAMDSLQVKEPLRLARRTPTFSPPPEEQEQPWVESIPGLNSPQGSNPTQGSKLSQDQNHPGDRFAPGMSADTGRKIARSSNPRKATPQDEAVLVAQTAETGLRRGYTRVPNSILMHLIEGECSKHEMQVRMPLGR